MPIKLLRENVDIYADPILDLKSEPMNNDKNEHTIGDLHGNAIKLFYFLIKQGIVKNIDAKDYKNLVDIYKKPVAKLEKQDLNLFNKILKKIKCIESQNEKVRFVGDELADRGSNDYFTLKILQKLHEQGIRLEILLSNHSAEFIKAYEIQQLNSHNKFVSQNLDSRFITSMINLQILMDKKLIDKKEVFSIYQTVYKPNLKLISYTCIAKIKQLYYIHMLQRD